MSDHDSRLGVPWVRFSGRSKGGPLDELKDAIPMNPRSTSFVAPRRDVPTSVLATELSPDYPGDGRGDRAPLDVPWGVGFGTGC